MPMSTLHLVMLNLKISQIGQLNFQFVHFKRTNITSGIMQIRIFRHTNMMAFHFATFVFFQIENQFR